MFDAEQLVLKLCMNSFYGVLGASRGFLRCKPAAAAVTATGRNMILATSKFAEEKYGAEVIYGVRKANTLREYVAGGRGSLTAGLHMQDTDSIFIKLPQHNHLTFPQLFELGQEIATATSDLFPDPVTLEFEKVVDLLSRCLNMIWCLLCNHCLILFNLICRCTCLCCCMARSTTLE